MAESVNYLLSAVTEGHLSNSTASQNTQTIDQAINKLAGGDNRSKKSTRSTIDSAQRGKNANNADYNFVLFFSFFGNENFNWKFKPNV